MSFLSTLGKAVKSRTVWVGIGTTTLGAAQLGTQILPVIAPYVPAGSKFSSVLTIVLGIATVIARIRAKQMLGPVIDTTIAKTVDAIHQLGISAEGAPATVVGQVRQIAAVAAVVKEEPTP